MWWPSSDLHSCASCGCIRARPAVRATPRRRVPEVPFDAQREGAFELSYPLSAVIALTRRLGAKATSEGA